MFNECWLGGGLAAGTPCIHTRPILRGHNGTESRHPFNILTVWRESRRYHLYTYTFNVLNVEVKIRTMFYPPCYDLTPFIFVSIGL